MKTIIAGSRDLTDYKLIFTTLDKYKWAIAEVISGTAKGIDSLGEKWASENKIPISRFKPNWKEYGKSAGFIRNQEMVDYAEGAIYFWDGKSKGTKDCIDRAKKKKIPVYIYLVEKDKIKAISAFNIVESLNVKK